jgi:hypothetical protein
VALCAVCTVQVKMRRAGFLVDPQNYWDGFLRFGLKIGGNNFFRFGLKTGGLSFLIWASKLAAPI